MADAELRSELSQPGWMGDLGGRGNLTEAKNLLEAGTTS